MDYIDYCDLMSRELYEHILVHKDGPELLDWLYSTYEAWESKATYKQYKQMEAGRKTAEANQARRRENEKRYLEEAEQMLKKNLGLSTLKLSMKLERKAEKEGWEPALRYETIGTYLEEAAEHWYVTEAESLIREDPRISHKDSVQILMDRAQRDCLRCVRKKPTVERYLERAPRLWYLAEGLKLREKDPELTMDELVPLLVQKAVREAIEWARREEMVRGFLTELGFS